MIIQYHNNMTKIYTSVYMIDKYDVSYYIAEISIWSVAD